MRKLFTLFAAAIMLLGVQNANASVKLKALAGSVGGDRNNNGGNANEGPSALIDEQTDTKFGTWDGYYGQPVYIIMEASAPIAPKSYELISANDTNGDTGRSWSQWEIYGGNFASAAEATIDAAGWTLIDNKQNQTLDKGKFAVNKLNISESIADGTYYSYFKIVVKNVEGGLNAKYCQMDGFRFTNVKFAPQDVTFTCTAGKNYHASNGEGIDKMFDLDCNTKYCGDAGSDCYALVTASEPVFVWGYDMTTANDNDNGRKVSKWSVYGTNDATVAANPDADGWVTLSDIDGSSPQYIEGKNWYTQRFFCNKSTVGTAYKYFKVVLNAGGFIQLSEFRFCYDTHRIVTYNWKSGPDASKNAFDGLPRPKWGTNQNITGSANAMTIETADGNSYAVKKYHFTTDDDGSWKDRAPKHWTIEGSNDESSWTKIAEVDDKYAIHNTNYTTYEFTPSNTTDAFRYVRLTLNEMKGSGGYYQIGDFQVLATSDVSDKDFYSEQVNEAKATAYDRGSLSETDPWYVEYKNLYDGLDAALATAISSGDYNQIPIMISKMNHLVELMDALKAKTNDYVAFDGTDTWGDGPWTNLLDGNDGVDGRTSTKWGGNFSGNVGDAGHVQYVIFRTKQAIQPYFYRLVTGGDTHTQTGRNWKSWKVYGANFTSVSDATYANVGNWTVLDERNNISAEYLPMENCYPAAFNFNKGVSQSYLYYMIAVTESNSTQQQMNEMYLCLQSEFEAMRAPLVAYFDDFDVTRPVETDIEDELADFNTKFAELKTTADAVRLTLLYNECVALRTVIEASMNYIELTSDATIADGFIQIDSAKDLVLFAKCVNGGKNDLNAALVSDIQLTATEMSAPIGTSVNPFKGAFNGQGHAIKGFTFSDTNENNVGLFGVTNGATIQKVMIYGANVNGNANVAGLVGNAQNASKILNCAVMNTYVEGRDHVAAIAGNLIGSSVVRNNLSDADIYSRAFQAGGMVGTVLSGAVVEKNLFTGSVECNGGNASGLVALIDADNANPTIKNNLVAATSVKGGATFTLINANSRTATFADNYILNTTVYSTGAKVVNNKDDKNGMQISLSEATLSDFYYELGWDMTNDWKYVARLVFPVLAYMDAVVPTEAITVTDAGYATYFTGAELDFGVVDGVEAFVPQVVGNNWIHLEPITYVPANIGIVVKAAAGTYNIPYSRILAKDVPSDLKAAPAGFTANGNQYILAKDNGVVAFYKAEGAITEGKGYVEITDGSGVKALFFEDDDATAIQTIDNGQQTTVGAIYNVAGQRLQKMQKGINIVNGKKVLK